MSRKNRIDNDAYLLLCTSMWKIVSNVYPSVQFMGILVEFKVLGDEKKSEYYTINMIITKERSNLSMLSNFCLMETDWKHMDVCSIFGIHLQFKLLFLILECFLKIIFYLTIAIK